MRLHEFVITHSANLRLKPGSPFTEAYLAPYTPEQQKNAAETGYDLARNLYRPHVSLTRYSSDHVPTKLPELPETDLSFDIHKICVCKADDNGPVYELIKEFNLA